MKKHFFALLLAIVGALAGCATVPESDAQRNYRLNLVVTHIRRCTENGCSVTAIKEGAAALRAGQMPRVQTIIGWGPWDPDPKVYMIQYEDPMCRRARQLGFSC